VTTIGVTRFSVAVSKPVTTKVKLNAAGRALLRARHGKLSASLALLRLAPAAFKAQSAWVRLQLRRRPSPNRLARSVPRGAIWLHYCRA